MLPIAVGFKGGRGVIRKVPISPPYKMKPRRLTSAGLFRFYIVLLIYYFISGLGMTSFSSQYVAWIKVCIGQSLVPRT